LVALLAIRHGMGTHQRKSALPVQSADIRDKPRCRFVAAGTVIANRLLMDVGVAGGTGCFCTGEDKACMAGPAIQRTMLPAERKCRVAMVKSSIKLVELPAVSIVTGITAHFKVLTMRRVRRKQEIQHPR
jgi:hypothetical protein